MKILMVGSYPKPYGGNSVHISRLRDKLIQDNNSVTVLDFFGESSQEEVPEVYRVGAKIPVSFFKLLTFIKKRFSSFDIFHFHVSAFGRFLYVGFFIMFFVPKKSLSVLTIHSGSFSFPSSGRFVLKERMILKLIEKFDHIITVNSEQKKSLVKAGVDKKSISVIPAFIPPKIISTDRVEYLLKDAKYKSDKLVITSGYMTKIYGYEQVIDSLSAYSGHKVTVVICHYSIVDEVYKSSLMDLIQELNINNVIMVSDLSPEEFSFLLSNSDLYIRATDRDGDAVAIRESISFGIPVVASDVVPRASQCLLYKYGSIPSLLTAVEQAFSEKNIIGAKVAPDYSSEIIKIYRS